MLVETLAIFSPNSLLFWMTKGRFCVFDKKRLQCMHNAAIYSRWRDGKKKLSLCHIIQNYSIS